MIHLLKDRDVEVEHVSGNEQRDDLASTIWRDLVAAGKPVDDEVRVFRLGTIRDDILPTRHKAAWLHHFVQDLAVLVHEVHGVRQLQGQPIYHCCSRGRGTRYLQ